MSEQRAISTQIVIVGGGPVGLGLAIDLAQRNVQSIVIEKYPEVHRVPKGQNMTQRTGEHFKAWHCQQGIRAATPIPRDFGIAGMMSYHNLLSGYHYDWLKRSDVGEFYAAENERLPQFQTERVLRNRAAELEQITFRYGWEAVDAAQNNKGATVSVVERGTGLRASVAGEFVVGCDGSHSRIRHAAGMEQTVDPHDKRMALLVFRSKELHELLARYPGKSYFNAVRPGLDGYWLFLGRVDLGEHWFFHAPVPSDTTEENFDFDTYLHKAVGAPFSIECDYIGFWDLRIANAKFYRKGRVLIAGDAAHSHPPYGGYGINLGFEDARNLAWKLAAELQGWAGPDLLDSYSLERQPVFASTAKDFITRFILEDRAFVDSYSPEKDLTAFETAWRQRSEKSNDDVQGFEPNYAGSPVVFGPEDSVCSAVGTHVHHARAGHHLSPQPLRDGRSVYDLLGDGFALLVMNLSEPVVREFVETAEKLKIPLVVIDCLAPEAQQKYDCDAVLVRPDHFVAWSGGATTGQAGVILSRSVGLARK